MSWIDLKRAREQRFAAIGKMQAITAKARDENRDMTPEEDTRFTMHETEARNANQEIDNLTRMEAVGSGAIPHTGRPGGDPVGTGAVGGGWTGQPENLNETRALRPGESCVQYLRNRNVQDTSHGVSLARYLRAMALGPANDNERRALGEGSTSTGGATVSPFLFANVIDLLRPATVCLDAGATVYPLTTASNVVARITGDAAATWRAENASVNVSAQTFDTVTFVPKTLAVIVQVSRELFADAVNLEPAVNQSFVNAFSVAMDSACLVGTGSSNQPLGISGASGVGSISMGTNGAALTSYAPLLNLVQTVETANSKVTSFVMHPRSAYELASLTDSLGQSIRKPESLANVPMRSTTGIPVTDTQGTSTTASRIIGGDWRNLLVGIRASMTVEFIRELYSANYQYAFLASMRMDSQVAHGASFAQIIGIN